VVVALPPRTLLLAVAARWPTESPPSCSDVGAVDHGRIGQQRARPSPDLKTSSLSPSSVATSDTLPILSLYDPNLLNLSNIELLAHFTLRTAPSFMGNTQEETELAKFRSNNAPQIGLAHPFVLHLLFVIASYHLASG
jgi:hypothetical protein